MIKNKSQFKKAVKENKNNIIIKRVYNLQENNKIPAGSEAVIKEARSNFIIINYKNDPEKRNIHIYYNDIEVKDNKIIYYFLLEEEREAEARKIIKEKYNNSINLIPLNEEEIKKYNKNSNYNYKYKYINIINEIIEL